LQTANSNLTSAARNMAIQRLTALWAFCESGLGGVMHALQIPFTGLVIGGMAVILICLIAQLAAPNYKQILQSMLIVLIVKAMVSPHTPFPAYVAVSFQGLLGWLLFTLIRVNLFSIFLLSILAMLESALQQLLILTLFFGQSFWKAADRMLQFIAAQFGVATSHASQWLVGTYLLIYLLGGIALAWMAGSLIRGFFKADPSYAIPEELIYSGEYSLAAKNSSRHKNRIWVIVIIMFLLSALLFIFAPNRQEGWMAVVKTISWTLSAILLWYLILGPLFTRLIIQFLQKKESRFSEQVSQTLAFLPVMRRIAAVAWQKSKPLSGWKRWHRFLSSLLHWTLTYTEMSSPEKIQA